MPDWFRRGVRFLLQPEQCVRCGCPVPGERRAFRRSQFVTFCSEGCAIAWELWE